MRSIIAILIFLNFSVTGFCQVAGGNNTETGENETTNTLVQDDTESPDTGNSNTTSADTVAQQTGNTQDEMTEENTTGYVGTKTNSSSGSPAVPANEGGEDGTNTQQRASLNIAGSKIPGAAKTETVKSENQNKATGAKAKKKKDEEKESRSEKKKGKKK